MMLDCFRRKEWPLTSYYYYIYILLYVKTSSDAIVNRAVNSMQDCPERAAKENWRLYAF